MDERESLVHPHAPKDSFATWWRTFYTRSSFRTAIISLAVLLVFAFAALVFGGRLPKGIAFLAPDDFVKGFGSCYQVGMYYADPVRLPHLFKSLQPDAQACQGECAISIGCTHFTYWPDGGCLLTGPTSHLKAAPEAYARSITGPRECPEVQEVPSHAAGEPSRPKVVDFSVDGAPMQLSVPHANRGSHKAQVFGQNGSRCSAYPTCAEDRLQGECCPNDEGVMLSCCKGALLKAEEAAAGSACTSFKACVAMNLREGACCPSPAGIRLSCCDL